MPIARMIYVSLDAEDVTEAVRLWKQDCAPLMISATGCLREELLLCIDEPGELISYSEWDDIDSIQRYEHSEAHQQIKDTTRHLRAGPPPVVKRYEVTG
jgi:quinol monooxygenase YgiN